MLLVLFVLFEITTQTNITVYSFEEWKIRFNKTFDN